MPQSKTTGIKVWIFIFAHMQYKVNKVLKIWCLIITFIVGQSLNYAYSQGLNFLAPVINRSLNVDTGVSIILTTGDAARFEGAQEEIPYTSSVQIIDADQSWPPRWYTSTPVYTDEMYKKDTSQGRYHLYMLMDVRIVGGYFSFYKILSNPGLSDGPLVNCEFAGYLLLNDKMEAVDTVRSSDAIRNLYFHDLAINAKGERLVNLRKDTYLDLRDYSNDYRDTAVHCNVDYLQILDMHLLKLNSSQKNNQDNPLYNQIMLCQISLIYNLNT